LANGADADLVRDNRRRFRLSSCLVVAAFLLSWLRSVLHMRGWFSGVIICVAMASLIAGFIGMMWAGEESRFLRRSDPGEPPRIFKL
jgi:Na+/H+-translocating membrane pyrophosphatase